MIDTLSYNFLKNKDEASASEILKYLRSTNNFKLGFILSEFFDTLFQHSFNIKEECAFNYYYSQKYDKAYSIYSEILQMKGLDDRKVQLSLFNQHFSINHVCDKYINYNEDIIQTVLNRPKRDFSQLTFTITTCKRFDLFEKTINSFLNCVDIQHIDNWFLVDDNSSEEDREKMKKLYPFFTFYFKTIEEKGHANSMNIIRNKVLNEFKTPYILHIEDDWKFFDKREYINDAFSVLEHNRSIGQCLFNKNYTEIESDISVKGGDLRIAHSGLRYYVHEYANTPEKIDNWVKKHGHSPSSYYWPHFSFRPSVLRTEILKKVGEFNKSAPHFEMEYAHRYVAQGYISAFFELLTCIHIGRLTSQKFDKDAINAYTLNSESQFVVVGATPPTTPPLDTADTTTVEEVAESVEEVNETVEEVNELDTETDETISGIIETIVNDFIDITDDIKENTEKENTEKEKNKKNIEGGRRGLCPYVVNLDRRPDRWENFVKAAAKENINYERFSAVDGSKLTSSHQLQRIFDNNDYNMKVGMLGCFMSHVKLYIQLINSDDFFYCILEDDITFTTEFEKKLTYVLDQTVDWDILYLGHHMRDANDITHKDLEIMPTVEKLDTFKSFQNSVGGTIGYLISKEGSKKLLDFIDETGATNCIDTMMQRSANKLNVYYCSPHLVFSECFRHNSETKVDSDIQHDFTSLTVPFEQKVLDELDYYKTVVEDGLNEMTYDEVIHEITGDESYTIYCITESYNIRQIKDICKKRNINCYSIENKVIFVINLEDKVERCFHAFKVDDAYSLKGSAL